MKDKGYITLIVIPTIILIWFQGCTMIRDMSTDEVRNPNTGEIEHVQKQYLTWERNMGKFIFFSMAGLTGFLWKLID